MANLITKNRDADIREFGLTTAQADTLLYLAENPGKSIVDVKNFFNITHQTAQGLVQRMAEKGLLKISPSINDARYKQLFLTEKAQSIYKDMEIPLSFAFGFLTDAYDFLIPELNFSFFFCGIFFTITMFITAMGVFLCVKTGFVLTPTDGIVNTISEVFQISFSTVKNIFDISLVALSVLLCPVNHANFYGIGTVLSAMFLGRIIKIYERYIPVN